LVEGEESFASRSTLVLYTLPAPSDRKEEGPHAPVALSLLQQRGNLVKERNYVVNRYRYINLLKKKFKAGTSPATAHTTQEHGC
jgi:hypothetical protein